MPRQRDPQTNQLLPEGVRAVVSERTGKVSYRARFSSGRGAQRRFHSRTFDDAGEAEAWLRSQQLDVARGRHRDTGTLTVADYYARWLPRMERSWSGSRARTVKMVWERYAAEALGGIRLQRLRRAECQFLVDDLARRGLKAATVRLYLVGVVSMLDDAMKDGLLDRNPATALSYPRDERSNRPVWSPLQLRAFLSRTAEDELGSLWAFLVATGCRIGEALAVHWRDVDLEAGTVWIHRTLSRGPDGLYRVREGTKTSRTGRTVPLDGWIVALLRELPRTAPLVWHQGGAPLPVSTVRWQWDRAVTAAGLPRITLHDVRHSVVSALVMAGANPRTVSDIVGHHSTSITMDIYTHSSLTTQRDALEALGGVLGEGERKRREA